MNQDLQGGSTWGADLRAGLVVCLVALPLCLGIALASGAPLVAGLITGVLGGVIVSMLGGTSLLVSGPAAGLAAIVLASLAELGSFEALLAATMLAGVMQLALGALRAGRLGALFPSAVITGMLAAIGVLLLLQQFPHLIGAPLDDHVHGLEMLAIPFYAVPNAMAGPTIVGVLCLGLLFLWDRPFMARPRALLPGPLLAVVAGVTGGFVLPQLSPALAFGAHEMVELPDLFGHGLGAVFTLPDLSALASVTTWRIAGTLAIVASLETLLSLEATDQMDPWRRRSDANRELVAQGLGNTVAGMIGGLPMTGVIVRSAANITAGGRTWRAAFAHGVLLAVAVAFLPSVLEHIPLAALAAILVHTGFKLASPSRFRAAFGIGAVHGGIVVLTVASVIATDLLIGVGIGLVASVIAALGSLGKAGVVVQAGASGLRLNLAGVVSFVHKSRISRALDDVPEGSHLTVDATGTQKVDHDILELLHSFAARAADRRIQVQMVGVPAAGAAVAH